MESLLLASKELGRQRESRSLTLKSVITPREHGRESSSARGSTLRPCPPRVMSLTCCWERRDVLQRAAFARRRQPGQHWAGCAPRPGQHYNTSGAAHTVVARRFSSFQSGRQGRSLQQAEICEPSPSTVITNTPLRCCLTNGLAVL